ncbi:MAG: ATP-dependent helicase [Candidatus Marinimicrobia bacterium]|nr:ATP-dependent helicase [Candidatus Neomarinimicrobiota bacterium]
MTFIPNTQQKIAIEYPPAPLMILAGAGTGKTSTIIHRIGHLIQSYSVNPEHIVVLTFTERANAELRKKIKELIGNQSENILISTFHSFCNRLVREFSDSPDAERLLIHENDIKFILLSRFDELTFLTSHQFRSDPIRAVTGSFIPFFNRVRDELLSQSEIQKKFDQLSTKNEKIFTLFPGINKKLDSEEILQQLKDLVEVYKTYQNWKMELGVTDYGDMILDCWNMLNEDEEILSKVRANHLHIIIDEYQDNNIALNKIVNLISQKDPSITVVGDEDQCIYSFRGANYYNIRDFESRYLFYPNYKVVKLEQNYRSTQEILDLANTSIANDSNRTDKILTSSDDKHGPKPGWHVGERLQTLQEIPKLVNKLILEQNFHYGDIAIICRTWSQVKQIAKTLQQATIPVDVYTEKFFNVPAVKDILAWGHFIVNSTQADPALFRILSQQMGISWTRSFFQKTKTGNIEEKIQSLIGIINENQLSTSAKEKLMWVMEKTRSLQNKLGQNRQADEMVWEILSETDILRKTRHSYRYMDRLNLINSGHLMSIAESFIIRELAEGVPMGKDKSLKHWLAYINILLLDLKYPAIQPESFDSSIAVQVLTVHKSKGLEFPVVMIPFLRAGSFPLRKKTSVMVDSLPEPWYQWPKPENITLDEEYINEERRIFYVAVTRAKEQLYLLGPSKAQSLLLKELENSNIPIMEILPMQEKETQIPIESISGIKQKLLVDLNREISAHQYYNATTIIEDIRCLDQNGKLSENSPYADFYPSVSQRMKYQDSRRVLRTILDSNLIKLSASSIEEYDQCSLKYRLDKIDRVPQRRSKVAMEFGIIIHNVLEEFHGSEDQSLEMLRNLLDKHWRQDAFEYLIREEEFKHQGEQILKDYFDFVEKYPPRVIGREKRFEFIIESLNVQISGKIDRIDKDGKYLSVVDYKTGKNKESAKNSLQLALYTEALKRDSVDGIQGIPGTATLHFLKHPDDPLSSHEFTEKDLNKHQERIKKVAEGIRKGIFNAKPNDYICQNCDYREFLCPAWEEK